MRDTQEPKDPKVNGTPDARMEPMIRIVIEAREGRIGVQGNAPARVQINVLTDAIVALAQQMVRDEKKTLVTPVTGAMPPLRRI